MKNDLLEKIDVGWLCLLSLSLVCATYGISAESRNLSNFKTVDYWHRYFADFPRFTGLYRGSKEGWNLISVWESLSKRGRKTNFS